MSDEKREYIYIAVDIPEAYSDNCPDALFNGFVADCGVGWTCQLLLEAPAVPRDVVMKLVEALKSIDADWGSDYADGNVLTAHVALEKFEAWEKGSGK